MYGLLHRPVRDALSSSTILHPAQLKPSEQLSPEDVSRTKPKQSGEQVFPQSHRPERLDNTQYATRNRTLRSAVPSASCTCLLRRRVRVTTHVQPQHRYIMAPI